jgi:hypothetical protein
MVHRESIFLQYDQEQSERRKKYAETANCVRSKCENLTFKRMFARAWGNQ